MIRSLFISFLMGVLILSLISCSSKSPNPELVNPNASPEAKKLIGFLHEIEGQYILSGHHNGPTQPLRWSNAVEEMTGFYPIVWGNDFSFNFRGRDPDRVRQAMIDTAKMMYERGHIITLMWHSCFPTECDSCSHETIWLWQPGVSEETWQELVTDGTDLNEKWKIQVDHVAKYLKQLQEANIPVLWRPYHEMNGIWFWWCNKKGENGFAKLWQMMYDRFTHHHKLNNLIWVWNANAPRDIPGDEAYPYELYFPGHDYVDVLAADVYHFDYKQSHHDDLKTLAQGKPIALGEVGRMPTPEILHQQPDWTWYMGWAGWLFKANSPDSVRTLYSSPRVLTIDEVVRDKDGNYSVNVQ